MELTGNTAFPKTKVKAFGLVRDRNGKPRIDGDPRQLHPSIRAAMTDDEMQAAITEWDEANGKG